MSESYEQKLSRKVWNDRHKEECVCDECVPPIADDLATLRADNESLRRRVAELEAENRVQRIQLEQLDFMLGKTAECMRDTYAILSKEIAK